LAIWEKFYSPKGKFSSSRGLFPNCVGGGKETPRPRNWWPFKGNIPSLLNGGNFKKSGKKNSLLRIWGLGPLKENTYWRGDYPHGNF